MKRFATAWLCLAGLFLVTGCSSSNEPTVVRTDEDKIAEYERLIAGEEEEAQEEEAADDGP